MKNSIFKKLVALSLAVLMLVGSGIGAAIAGIDLAGLVGIKASAENPHNDIFYDEEKGLFFEVIGGRATILGSAREAVLDSPCMDNGVYTLPNKVTDSLTGIDYFVFALGDYALFNFRLDVTKLIIPDNFRALFIPEASFAGWDNLTDVQWDIHNAIVEGPLFEWLCEWDFYDNPDVDLDGNVINNCFPVRDEYGSPIFDATGTMVLVRFYSTEYHNGYTTSFYDMYIPFDDALNHYSPQTLTNVNTVSMKDITLVSGYWFEIYREGVTSLEVPFGIYDLVFNHDYSPDYPENLQIEDVDWNYASSIAGNKLNIGTVAMGAGKSPSGNTHENIFDQSSVRGVAGNISNIIDGNASYHENTTIALHKSPVKVLTLGSNVKHVPDYLCYDLEIETINLQNVKSVGNYSFVDCNALSSVNLSNIEIIGTGAFASCDGLTSIDLSNVDSVAPWAFAACDGFTEVTIPANLSDLRGGAFSFCDNISKVRYETTDCKITVEDVAEHTFGCRPSLINRFSPFTECKLLTSMIFGPEVTVIPYGIAYNVTTLKSVTFLGDIETIQAYAFYNCDSLETVVMQNPDLWDSVVIENSFVDADGDGEDDEDDNESIRFEDIIIHSHTFTETVVPPTCEEDGYTAEICECGAISPAGKYNIVERTGHDYVETTVSPTCTSEGYSYKICSKCGSETEKYDITPVSAHSFGTSPKSVVNVSCNAEGYELYECSVCGATEKRNVQSALGHDYSDTRTYPASCTEAGRTVGVCSRCQDEKVLETIPALGHDYGEYIYNNDATETRDGTETARCSRCGATDTRTAPGTSYQGKLSNAVFNPGEEKTVEHRSKVVITSRAANVPDGFHLGIVVNNKLVAEGDNTSVQYTVNEITEDTTFYTYIYDASGKIATKNPHKTDVANVNTGFFAKIVSFFKGLFGMLPTVNFG